MTTFLTTTPVAEASLLEEWRRWRDARHRELREPHGWLSLTGLHWLDERPRPLDDLPGRWSADSRAVCVSARAGDGLVIEGRPVDGPTRSSIRQQRSAVCGSVGDVRLEVLRREGRYGIRVRDPGRRCEPGVLRGSRVPAYAAVGDTGAIRGAAGSPHAGVPDVATVRAAAHGRRGNAPLRRRVPRALPCPPPWPWQCPDRRVPRAHQRPRRRVVAGAVRAAAAGGHGATRLQPCVRPAVPSPRTAPAPGLRWATWCRSPSKRGSVIRADRSLWSRAAGFLFAALFSPGDRRPLLFARKIFDPLDRKAGGC